MLEPTELFTKSLGTNSDIINKEMFTFNLNEHREEKEEKNVCLRPEITASIAKYSINNNQYRTKVMYFGQNFRRERPQKGRYRQFNQFGFEIIGIETPFREIEIFCLIDRFFKAINLNYYLKINSIGNKEDRIIYNKVLEKYFKKNYENLSLNSQKRYDRKAFLRILDSKSEEDKEIIEKAPKIIDYLNKDSKSNFNFIKDFLDKSNIKFLESHLLVRGLDYYNDIVFEICSDTYEAAQDSLGGGGAYDSLIESFGGQKTKAFGLAFGVERLMLNISEIKSDSMFDSYIVVVEPHFEVLKTIYMSKKFKIIDCFVNIKKALEKANQNKIKYLIIIGQEYLEQKIIIKDLEKSSQQEVHQKDFLNL